MSPRHFSRLSLCAAAVGALAIAAVAVSPSRAAEDAVVIPPPAVDVQAADGIQTAVIAGGCFWGVQGVFQHTAGVRQRGVRLCRRQQDDRELRPWSATGTHRTCRVGRDQVRSEEDQLRQDPADLLLGGARSDPAQPPGARTPARSIARRSSPPTTSRRRWRTPISPSSTPPRSTRSRSSPRSARCRRSIRRRTITRTT